MHRGCASYLCIVALKKPALPVRNAEVYADCIASVGHAQGGLQRQNKPFVEFGVRCFGAISPTSQRFGSVDVIGLFLKQCHVFIVVGRTEFIYLVRALVDVQTLAEAQGKIGVVEVVVVVRFQIGFIVFQAPFDERFVYPMVLVPRVHANSQLKPIFANAVLCDFFLADTDRSVHLSEVFVRLKFATFFEIHVRVNPVPCLQGSVASRVVEAFERYHLPRRLVDDFPRVASK